MTRKLDILFTLSFVALLATSVFAQPSASTFYGQTETFSQTAKYPDRPKDKLELGFSAGSAILAGDIGLRPGVGLGMHFRKSWNYVTSFRFGYDWLLMYNQDKNGYGSLDNVLTGNLPSDFTWKSRSSVHSYSLDFLINLSNVNFHKSKSDWGFYVYPGISGFTYQAKVGDASVDGSDYTSWAFTNRSETSPLKVKFGIAGSINLGGGVTRRLSDKASITLDNKLMFAFDDLVDGRNRQGISVTQTLDLPIYTSIRFNMNLGDDKAKSAPLWWVNPLDMPMDKLADLDKKINDVSGDALFADEDGDGVPNKLDKEMNSPAGAIVDTRGVTLDSDKDGVPDYSDNEPYSSIGAVVDGNGVQTNKPTGLTESDVIRIGQRQGWDDKPVVSGTFAMKGDAMSSWFLPMIHFDNNRYNIKSQYHPQLHHVATVMKNNSSLKVVVDGHANSTGSQANNNRLAYNRAKSAIDYIVKNYGISRSRFVLTYEGETQPLPGTSANNFMNRRVEFNIANGGEYDMSAPSR